MPTPHRFGKTINEKHTYNRTESKHSDVKWTDKAGIAIQGFSVIITLLLFAQVIRQNNIAAKSTALADSSARQAKRSADAAESTFQFAKQSSTINDSISAINFNLNKQSVEAQIKSLTQSTNRFEIENEPILQIIQCHVTEFEPNSDMVITIMLSNFGRYPAKVLASGYYREISEKPPDYNKVIITREKEPNEVKEFLSYQYPLVQKPHFKSVYPENRINLEKEIRSIFFLGFIDYENVVTKILKRYKFMFQLNPFNSKFDKCIFTETAIIK